MKVMSNTLIQKVKYLVCVENLATQKNIASKVRISNATVNKIINKDLQLKVVQKPKVHELLPKYFVERKRNCI